MVQRATKKNKVFPGREAMLPFSPDPKPTPSMPTRYQQLIDGEITIRDLDKDELRLGKLRNPDGSFSRGNPKYLAEATLAAMQRELHKRLFDEINKHAFDAVNTIVDVMHQGEGASAFQGQKDGTKKLDAAKYLLERVIGKIPDKTENTTEITVWQGLNESGGLFVDVDAEEISYDPPRAIEPEKVPETPRKRGPRTRPNRPVVDPS